MHNLPWSCTWQQLKDTFREWKVERADIVLDAWGKSRCAGMGAMAGRTAVGIAGLNCSRLQAGAVGERRCCSGRQAAGQALRGMEGVCGCRCVQQGSSAQWQPPPATHTASIPLTPAHAHPPAHRPPQRGFGTVRFTAREDAEAAIEKLNNSDFEGRTITVRLDRYA